jgi:hypothetical protein
MKFAKFRLRLPARQFHFIYCQRGEVERENTNLGFRIGAGKREPGRCAQSGALTLMMRQTGKTHCRK